MVNVRYGWLHLPQFCQCPHHEQSFASGESAMSFLDEQAALGQFAQWNGAPGRCYQYTPFAVERIPHQRREWE